VCNVSQAAALAALSGSLDFTATMRAAFDVRRRRMHELLSAIPGVSSLEPEGAFYAFPSFEGVLGRDINGRRPRSTLELAEVLLEEAAVAIVPGEAFGAPGYARLSYALGEDELVEGLTRLAEVLGG
jgi:aspartate/methionine/tyrosine aminotransferase